MQRGGRRGLLAVIVASSIACSAALLTWRSWPGLSASLPQRTVDLTYRFTVSNVPVGAKRIVAWVPVPRSSAAQRLEYFRVQGGWPYVILTEGEYGNRFIRFDLSRAAAGEGGEIVVAVNFRVMRKAYRAPSGAGSAQTASQAGLARFLAPDRLVPIDGKIAEEAWRVAGGVEGRLAQARRLYDHIVSSVTYDKSGEGWGQGDALYACNVRAGNCTDFHSLFIGEARAIGIPARFVMGLPLPDAKSEGTIPGYHCWAEFYVEGQGWLPVDASEASKHREKGDIFFGGLDQNRVEFTVGRDICIPEASAGPLNYVIYPRVEMDGQPHEEVETLFSFRDADE